MHLSIPDTKTIRETTYKKAGDARYAEAVSLKGKHPSGAIYLAGYLVECYLKWALCRRARVQYLQDLADRQLADGLTSGKGHNLEHIATVTGYDMHLLAEPKVRRAFQIAAVWSPNIRYVRACGGCKEAVQFLAAVRVLKEDIRRWANP
jgi:hypothetical protein